MEPRVPFQVMLEREQHHRLGRVAVKRGVSVGALIRESVAAYLSEISVEDDPLFGLIGMARDDGPKPHGDVAANAASKFARASESPPRVAEVENIGPRASRSCAGSNRRPRDSRQSALIP